ncbi:hypothetical protein [uncultured Lacinutrix sp.]|uniref:hypothetical protein n=1 Tax=uncultured Lacinutrix sp. TaxID=574032 RepID=UPI0026189671|nr:hypothetical protein [uncultured Lacinutrix sp.]
MKQIELPYCSLKIEGQIIISIIKEGIHITEAVSKEIINTIKEYIKNKPFVYISHRLHSYSVDPITYLSISKINELLGFAVVSNNSLSLQNIEIEKLFLKKPFESFDLYDDAINWANTLIKTNYSTQKFTKLN